MRRSVSLYVCGRGGKGERGGMQARAAPTDQTQTFWVSCALTLWSERWPPFLLMERVLETAEAHDDVVLAIVVWAAEASLAMQPAILEGPVCGQWREDER